MTAMFNSARKVQNNNSNNAKKRKLLGKKSAKKPQKVKPPARLIQPWDICKSCPHDMDVRFLINSAGSDFSSFLPVCILQIFTEELQCRTGVSVTQSELLCTFDQGDSRSVRAKKKFPSLLFPNVF